MRLISIWMVRVLAASLLVLAALAKLSGFSSEPLTLTPPSTPIPREFFGLHIHRAFSTTPWPPVPFGSWRLWDARVHWPQVELRKNEWQWDILDREVELAEKHHVDLLLPFGETPSWAAASPSPAALNFPRPLRGEIVGDVADLEDWRNFIRTQAARYKGRILYYEIWNEPNLPRNRVIGTPERMLTLAREAYTTLKQVDPNIKVISPSPVNPNGIDWLDRYLELGGGNYADIIGYHFYVRTRPESMLDLILPVKEVMRKHGLGDKPLWNTESGWIRNELTVAIDPLAQAPGWAARAYILNWAAGVQRFYWYAWDDDGHDSIPFTNEDQATATISARAYGEVQKWLVGSRMESCRRQGDATWICRLTEVSGRPAVILWNEDHTSRLDVSREWEMKTLTKLSGEHSAWSGSQFDVSELPVLLEGLPPRH
ncbi:MAG TPA: glycosyl hydrolase [Terriglobia bacterium]|nr:glycosyl hydrolase [Terriglobia bacterium]